MNMNGGRAPRKYQAVFDTPQFFANGTKHQALNRIASLQSTYKGVDIETIEIKADVETSATRRSHNYRLVMMYKSSAKVRSQRQTQRANGTRTNTTANINININT